MPVYRNHRVAHIHIPKTAGTAIERLFVELDDRHSETMSFSGRVQRPDRWYEDQHLTLNELRELSQDAMRWFDIFAVVRNPYQRLLSEYHWRRSLVYMAGTQDLIGFMSFDALVAAIPMDLDHNWHRYIAMADRDHANLLIHLRPQWQYVCDAAGRRDDSVTIVRFEHLRDDIEPLYRRWHVQSRLLNLAPPALDLAEYFTDESLAVVNAVYARDFEWFGYERVEAVRR